MDSKFAPKDLEDKIYKSWETEKLLEAKAPSKRPAFSIILPPPNANADLHLGHAMYVYEDILIRYHKMRGFEVLWIPGADHAGFETQYVFEKYLAKQDKSRFDYEREILYKLIWDFVAQNRPRMEAQLRRLGFFLDWSRSKFTLDPDIVEIVHTTFKKMFDSGLIYRADRLVNYCTKDGTSFSDLEVKDVETDGSLYFINFPLTEGGFIQIATTRPETILGDAGVMVNPKDKRYKKLIGKTVILPVVNRKVPIIADEYVDMKFGTGAVKVTPNHDFNDFEIAKKHNLKYPVVIGFDGRMKNTDTEYDGLKVAAAREKIVEELKKEKLLLEIKKHKMVVATCYKCGRALEPLPLAQWYVKVRPLADQAIKIIKAGEVKFLPVRFKKTALTWLMNFHDWNISRQVVWGIRIPAWECQTCHIWTVTAGNMPKECDNCGGKDLKQDPDTFDTWFSSAQWPFATLKSSLNKSDFQYFYPTSVMETGYDILPWWVCRMIMIGLYSTGKVPFKTVFLHGMVRDKKGQKMSKSKGNVINPLEMVDKYGADALRATLIFGTKEGSDQSLAEEKIVGMRNFTNKIWNIGRFLDLNSKSEIRNSKQPQNLKLLNDLKKEFEEEKKKYLKAMEGYRFSQALGEVYEFLWHRFADYYIEELKEELQNGNIEVLDKLKEVYFENLKMLHPFLPFVTEAVWQVFKGADDFIINSKIA